MLITFLSLVNSGLHEDGFTPLTAKHIYKPIVLPKALYECELWSQLSPTQLSTLERDHRFCVKFMQSLPRNTDTDVTLSLLGLNSIELEIDYRKMVFLGQLCRLPSDCALKQIFMYRLSHYTKNRHLQRGFIYRILGKYSLIHSLEQFIVTGNFINKYRWKSIIREKLAIFTRQQY